MSRRFDAAYYRKHYEDPRTRVGDLENRPLLADFLFAYLKYLEVPIARVLDIGAGTGLWRREVLRHYPSARYVGVDRSAHACRKYGWERGSVTDYRSTEDFDLVICDDVLQYLDDAEADAALRNLTRLARSALRLKVITAGDWENNCDQERTDRNVHLRPASWYRKRLERHFIACGGGLFIARSFPVALLELEYFG
jgi:trans-aconitate methyltransferase